MKSIKKALSIELKKMGRVKHVDPKTNIELDIDLAVALGLKAGNKKNAIKARNRLTGKPIPINKRGI